MASSSWVRTIKKACTFFNNNHTHKDKKSQQGGEEHCRSMDHLQGQLMACGYEDVQVMWSILDKSRTKNNYALTS